MPEEFKTRQKKKRIYNTILKPAIVYSSEVWHMHKTKKNKLLAVEMDFWRRAARRSKWEQVKNEDVRRYINVTKTNVEDIET